MTGKTSIKIIIMLISGITLFTSCSLKQNETYSREELENLAKIEIYSAKDDTLLKTITDEETLYQYNQHGVLDNSDIEERQKELKENAENLTAEYNLVSYKHPVARFGGQEAEKNYTITLYEDSNIIKMTVSEESIKNMSLPEEFLTFYYEISDENMAFYRSLVENE